jgi:hypothetical protein
MTNYYGVAWWESVDVYYGRPGTSDNNAGVLWRTIDVDPVEGTTQRVRVIAKSDTVDDKLRWLQVGITVDDIEYKGWVRYVTDSFSSKLLSMYWTGLYIRNQVIPGAIQAMAVLPTSPRAIHSEDDGASNVLKYADSGSVLAVFAVRFTDMAGEIKTGYFDRKKPMSLEFMLHQWNQNLMFLDGASLANIPVYNPAPGGDSGVGGSGTGGSGAGGTGTGGGGSVVVADTSNVEVKLKFNLTPEKMDAFLEALKALN